MAMNPPIISRHFMYVLILNGCFAHLMSLQHCQDLDTFRSIHKLASGQAHHRHIFYVCQMYKYENWSVEAVMEQASKIHLVVQDMVQCNYKFDKGTFLEFFRRPEHLIVIGKDIWPSLVNMLTSCL